MNKSVIKGRTDVGRTLHGTVAIPFAKDTCEKIRRNGNRHKIRAVFKTKHTIPSSPVSRPTGPVRDLLE
jgi:hypothetical protein